MQGSQLVLLPWRSLGFDQGGQSHPTVRVVLRSEVQQHGLLNNFPTVFVACTNTMDSVRPLIR